MRGRGWLAALHEALERELRGPDGKLTLTVEIIYGHALKPLPRAPVGEQTSVPMEHMRAMLRGGRR